MPWQKVSTVKWLILTISLSLLLSSCGPKKPSATLVGVPDAPSEASSLDSLLQGLRYIREHPSEREDERVQRFLWVDQWASILKSKNNLNPDLAQEFWKDLTNFVQEPPMSAPGISSILERAETQLGKNVAYYQLYLTSLKSNSVEQAMSHLSFIQDDGVSDLHRRAAQLLELQSVRAIAESRRVGVLIPLTGEFTSFGSQILGSIQLASELAYADGIEFLIADSGSTNDQLLESFQKLTLEDKVSVIIGPVTSDATAYVFERAQILRTPVISLAPRENLEFFGDFNFRSTLTLEDQLNSLARFIRSDLSSKRVGILFPDSNYGWDVMENAIPIFQKNSIDITEMQVYAKDATDFKEELKHMTRLDFPKLRADELCPKDAQDTSQCVKSLDDLPPLYTFETLFIPDFADKAGLVLPTLPFLRLYGIQVVGLSGMNSPRLIERGQQSAEGVIFTDAFFESSENIQTQFFVENYKRINGTNPSKLAAESFDMAVMLIDIMKQIPGPVTREEMLQRISSVRSFEGVTGKISADRNQLRKQARFFVVRNGKIKELE